MLALDAWLGLSLAQQLWLAIPAMLLVPIVFFRHARSIWLAIDHLIASRDSGATWWAATAARPACQSGVP